VQDANDRLLGQLAVEKGFLTPGQLAGLLKVRGRLAALLVERGWVTPEQLDLLIDEALTRARGESTARPAETMMICPTCAAPMEVSQKERGKSYRCRKCGMELDVVSRASDASAFERGNMGERPAGERFGKFVLESQVGAGGFGTVYKAFQTDLGRIVAIKILRSESPMDLERFVREAQTVAKLSHPNVVPIYEVGVHEGKHYIAMEFIDGPTLDRVRLEPRKALETIRDAALAVHQAHEKGVIHRDLKPANMILDPGRRVRVMDFGLARPLQKGTTLTVSGFAVGTPAYMAPEQAEASECDARTDVYGLGATLYDLLTGHKPFEAEEALQVMIQISSQDPKPVRRHDPKVPRDVEPMVSKAMEKLPARRRWRTTSIVSSTVGRFWRDRRAPSRGSSSGRSDTGPLRPQPE